MKKFLFSLFVVAGTLIFTTNANAHNPQKHNCGKTQKEEKSCCTEKKNKEHKEKSCCAEKKNKEQSKKSCCKDKKHDMHKHDMHKHDMHKHITVEKRVERHMSFLKKAVDINSKESAQLTALFTKYEKQRDENRKTLDAKKVKEEKMTRKQRQAFHKTQRNLRETKRVELHKEITIILGEKRAEKFIKACESRYKEKREESTMDHLLEAPVKEGIEPMEEMPILEDF